MISLCNAGPSIDGFRSVFDAVRMWCCVYIPMCTYNHGILGMMLKLEGTILHVYVSSTGLWCSYNICLGMLYIYFLFKV